MVEMARMPSQPHGDAAMHDRVDTWFLSVLMIRSRNFLTVRASQDQPVEKRAPCHWRYPSSNCCPIPLSFSPEGSMADPSVLLRSNGICL